MKMLMLAAACMMATAARALIQRAPSSGLAGRAAAARAYARPPKQVHQDALYSSSASGRAAANVTLSARGGGAGASAAEAGVAPAAAPHHRALEQLEQVERALHAHLSVPGIPFKLGVDTVLGRVPFAGERSLGRWRGSCLGGRRCEGCA